MSDQLPMPVTTLTKAQRTSVLNLLRRTARAEILPRFRSLSTADIRTKTGPLDLVTDADQQAEKMIARGLLSLFPNALIIGEEDISDNPGKLDQIAEAETAFTIDPIDGTWNFAHGLAAFGVILSMLRFGKPVFSALYDPVLDDVVVAEKDAPAKMMRPNKAARTLSVSKGGPLETLSGFVGLHHIPKAHQPQMAATFPLFERATSLRCSCQEFRMMAQGHIDFLFTSGLTPWDHAAGVLAVQSAGGHVALLDGSEYTATAAKTDYLLSAPDAVTWGRLAETFSFLLDSNTPAQTAENSEA